jgi:hypothetical protein
MGLVKLKEIGFRSTVRAVSVDVADDPVWRLFCQWLLGLARPRCGRA